MLRAVAIASTCCFHIAFSRRLQEAVADEGRLHSRSKLATVLLGLSPVTFGAWKDPVYRSKALASRSNARAEVKEHVHSLIPWAASRGAYVASEVKISGSADSLDKPRGLFASSDVPAGAALITLPDDLLFGLNAVDDDVALTLMENTPAELWNVQLAIALCAEMRRGNASTWSRYFRELPSELSSCLAPGYRSDGTSVALAIGWPPTATRAVKRRRAFNALYDKLVRVANDRQIKEKLPSLEELLWATAIAYSRAVNVRGAPGEFTGRAARLLPIIDFANHAPGELANVVIRNDPSSDNPMDVSLYARQPISAGEELLLDYGHGKTTTNERLLLDYGFILPLDKHPLDTMTLPFGAIQVGLEVVVGEIGHGEAAIDELALLEKKQLLLAQLGDIESAGLVFYASGEPSNTTLAVALVLAAQQAGELNCMKSEDLVMHAREVRSNSPHVARAWKALHVVVGEALKQVEFGVHSTAVEPGGFEATAHAYIDTRRVILERAINVTRLAYMNTSF